MEQYLHRGFHSDVTEAELDYCFPSLMWAVTVGVDQLIASYCCMIGFVYLKVQMHIKL